MNIDKITESKIEMIIELAFECGRTFENRYIGFGLNDTINFEDFKDAEGMGAMFGFEIKQSDKLKQMIGKGITDRRKKALSDPIDQLAKAKVLLFKKQEE